MIRVERNLHEVARDISTADLLLYRGQGWISKLICMGGRSEYSHAAKVDRLGCDGHLGNELFCVEVRELKGGRIVTLASQVLKYPGRIDVYSSNPNNLSGYDRQGSAAHMRLYAGQDYGWAAVVKVLPQFLPGIRLYVKTEWDLEATNGTIRKPPFCSMACAAADRIGGGVDPVSNLADRFTLPGDLARSSFYRYQWTLMGV